MKIICRQNLLIGMAVITMKILKLELMMRMICNLLTGGSRDKGQVKLVAAKMKERAPADALDDHHGDSDDK